MKSWLALLFLFLCVCGLVACAENDTVLDATSNTAAEATVGWKAGPTGRGTLMLVYGCLSTVFASTWTVLHLNVPDPKEPWWKKAGRKAKWMGITVLFPEFIFSKAVCELRLAVADLYDMHVALEKANLEYTDTIMRNRGLAGDEKIILKWTWHADFGTGMRFMYRFLRLGQATPAGSEQPVAVQPTGSNHGSSSTPPVVGERDESETGPDRTSANVVSTPVSDVEGSDQVGNDKASLAAEASGHQSHVGQSEKLASTNAPGGQATEVDTASQNENGDNFPSAAALGLPARRKSPPQIWEVSQPGLRMKWTLVHSFYANMGGLLCAQTYGEPYPIVANKLVNAAENATRKGGDRDLFKLLDLSKADIEDKSKADWLLKAIAVTQITWLIMNVWARAITNVPVTQLEIATVAFSLMAIATYASCWWKPKDVGQPTLLTRLPMTFAADNRRCSQSFVNHLLFPSKSGTTPLDFELPRISNDTIWLEGEPPMPVVMLWLMALSSIVFGGLHCLAWNFEFPSEVELVLWRVASITSAILPVFSLGITFLFNNLATSFVENRHTAAVVRLLAPLRGFPDQYWELMGQDPPYVQWSWESWFVVRTLLGQKRPGDAPSDWEEEPAPQLPRDAPHDAEEIARYDLWALEDRLRSLQEFTQSWTAIKGGTAKQGLASEVVRLVHSIWYVDFHQRVFDTACPGQIREYEAFLRAKLGGSVPESAPPCVRDFIISLRPKVEELEREMDAFKTSCDRASRNVTISAGILYATSRAIILVL